MVFDSDDVIRYSVEFTLRAKEDLRKIYEFIEESAESAYIASRQINMIEKNVMSLSILPNGCPKYDDEYSYRVCHIKKYCVIFNVDDAAHKVSIVRIFHARQDTGTQELQ